MVLSTLGSIGIGLVWGWLVGSLEGHLYHPWRTVAAAIVATLTIIATIMWFVSGLAIAFFFGATVVAFLLRAGFRRELRQPFR